MILPDVTFRELRKDIQELKASIAELEARLQKERAHPHQGSLRSVSLRVLISAERIDDICSMLEGYKKSERAASWQAYGLEDKKESGSKSASGYAQCPERQFARESLRWKRK
jgi:hypothetical protein